MCELRLRLGIWATARRVGIIEAIVDAARRALAVRRVGRVDGGRGAKLGGGRVHLGLVWVIIREVTVIKDLLRSERGMSRVRARINIWAWTSVCKF